MREEARATRKRALRSRDGDILADTQIARETQTHRDGTHASVIVARGQSFACTALPRALRGRKTSAHIPHAFAEPMQNN